jgi:hypothetical protein
MSFQQHAQARDIDFLSESTLIGYANSQHACSSQDIVYEEKPFYGIRSVFCHGLAIYSLERLQEISKHDVFLSGPHSKTPQLHSDSYGHYNPSFINWFFDELDGKLNNDSFFIAFKTIYQGLLKPLSKGALATFYQLNGNKEQRNNLLALLPNIKKDTRRHFYKTWAREQQVEYKVDLVALSAFWLRRFSNDNAVLIAGRLENVLKKVDLKMVNEERHKFGLSIVTNSGASLPTERSELEYDKDLEKLTRITNDLNEISKEYHQRKIILLKRLRFKYVKPDRVAEILYKLGSLMQSVSPSKPTEGYGSSEIQGFNYFYLGNEYRTILELYPDTKYAVKAAYKIAHLNQGGECEGFFDCELEASTERLLHFLENYSNSYYTKKAQNEIYSYISNIDKYETISYDNYAKSIEVFADRYSRIIEQLSDYQKLQGYYTLGIFYKSFARYPSALLYVEKIRQIEHSESIKYSNELNSIIQQKRSINLRNENG